MSKVIGKKTGLGWWNCISNYIYETTTCLFSLINCDMNSTCSTLLPNSAALTKNNKHKVCLLGAFFPPHDLARPGFFPLDMMAIFQSTGYLGFSSVQGGNWRENRNLPLRNNEVSGGEDLLFLYFFDWCKVFVSSWDFCCSATWVLLFWFLVCVLVVESWNYMKGMSKTKIETDWTVEPCLWFKLFSKWVDQRNTTKVFLHMQCFALLLLNRFACSIVGNMLTSSYSHQLVDVPGSSPWSEVERHKKTPGGNPGSPTGHHTVIVVGLWISPFFKRFSSWLEDDPFLLER